MTDIQNQTGSINDILKIVNRASESFAFEIFYENFTYPIAIAGRYKIITSNKTFDAVGSTIYINHLRKINFKK